MTPQNLLRANHGNISEFATALFILLLFIVLPLINMVALGMGAASASAFTHQAATVAAAQRRYSDALDAMQSESRGFTSSGFCCFIKLQPTGGYRGCGADMYINAENYRAPSTTPQTFGPNTPVPSPVDISTYEYECTVQLHYQQSPFLNLSALPLVGSVPGLGRPVQLTFSASRAVEYPPGLEGNGGTLAAGPAATSFNTAASPDTVPPAQLGVSLSGWNYPNIYNMIAAAGQTVVTSEVVQVPANLPIPPQSIASNWTNAGVTIVPGQKVWMDLRSDGMWTTADQPPVNANGSGAISSVDRPTAVDPAAPYAALIGRVGSTTPFVVGVDLLNFAPGSTGPVNLIINDGVPIPGFTDNAGMQTVRVIVTQ